MTVLTPKTKAQLIRNAFAELARQYTAEGRTQAARSVVEGLADLSDNGKNDESVVKLFDILDSLQAKPAHPLDRFVKYAKPEHVHLTDSRVLRLMADRAFEGETN